jgi:hypothetical protein
LKTLVLSFVTPVVVELDSKKLLTSYAERAGATCSGWGCRKDPSEIFRTFAERSQLGPATPRGSFDGSKMMVMMGIDGDVLGKSKNSCQYLLRAAQPPDPHL